MGHSSAGRAPALQAGGREFDPPPGSTTMLYWLSWRLCGSAHYFYCYLSQKPIGCRRGFLDVQLLRQMRLP